MNGKWIKFGALAVALLVGLFVAATVVSAQGPYGPGGMPGGMGGHQNSLIAVAARVIGIDEAALIAELNTGKSIAEVAVAKGVTLDTILDAFIAPHAEMLKNAVAAGRLTQAQADANLAQMKAHVLVRLTTAFQPGSQGMGQGYMGGSQNGTCPGCGANGTNQPNRPGGRWGR